MKNLSTTLLFSSIALALSACGGGSGGSADSPETGAAQSQSYIFADEYVVISQDNGNYIAANAMQTGVQASDSTDATDGYAAAGDLALRTVSRARLFSGRQKHENTVECDSGSLTLTWNDADNSEELDSGDTLTAAYDMCVFEYDDSSLTTDGNIVIRINAGDFESTSSDITGTYQNLLMFSSEEYSRLDGSMRIASDFSGNVESVLMSSDALLVEGTDEAMHVSGFALDNTYDTGTNIWTMSYDAELKYTKLEGNVAIDTLMTFEGIYSDEPTVGEMQITGANGSYVLIDANTGDDDTVYVTIYDGSLSVAQELTWDELYAAAE